MKMHYMAGRAAFWVLLMEYNQCAARNAKLDRGIAHLVSDGGYIGCNSVCSCSLHHLLHRFGIEFHPGFPHIRSAAASKAAQRSKGTLYFWLTCFWACPLEQACLWSIIRLAPPWPRTQQGRMPVRQEQTIIATLGTSTLNNWVTGQGEGLWAARDAARLMSRAIAFYFILPFTNNRIIDLKLLWKWRNYGK